MFSILLLALAPSAHAWEHIGVAWVPAEDWPLQWYMGEEEEETLDAGYSLEVLQVSWDAWQAAECAGLENEYVGTSTRSGRDRLDGFIDIFWNDPDNETEVGVLGVTYPQPGLGVAKETATMIYKRLIDADIVFNDNVAFASDAQILESCGSEYSIQGVATHEIGHLHGLEHSCQDGDPCDDALLAEATMYWSVGSCSLGQSDINQDDIDSITALYGPFASFAAVTDRIGGNPLTVQFAVSSDNDGDGVDDVPVVGVTWSFGDGSAESTEINPSHEYTEAGQFTVQAEIVLADPACEGETTYTYDELGYIVACDEPQPAVGADGFFTMGHSDGLTWTTLNHTDVSVYGCVDTIAWEVYKGSGEGAISAENLVDLDGDDIGDSLGAWAPNITFPAEGTYTVVMNVGGPGGLKASFLTVEVVDIAAEGGGCASVPSALGLSLGGLALAAAVGLRRRRA